MSHLIDPYNHEESPLFIVISGASGVGKDATIIRMKELGYPFHFVVTATTRPSRSGEQEGVDYFFVSIDEFTRMIEADELLEYALVYGNYKGVPKKQVRQALASGQDVIMRVDVQGAATISRLVPEAVLIYISAESEEEMIRRLRARETDTEEQIKTRIATAKQELKQLELFDYVVINVANRLDESCHKIAAIITAEKCRVKQREIRL